MASTAKRTALSSVMPALRSVMPASRSVMLALRSVMLALRSVMLALRSVMLALRWRLLVAAVFFLFSGEMGAAASGADSEVTALNKQAFAAIERRDYKGAIELLQRAETLDPNNYFVQTNYGFALGQLGRDREAFAHDARAYGIDPNKPESVSHVACSYGKLKDYQHGLDVCKRYTSKNPSLTPENFCVYDMQAWLLAMTKQSRASYDLYRKLLAMHPTDEELWNKATTTLAFGGGLQEALLLSKEFIARFPNSHYIPEMMKSLEADRFQAGREQVQQAALKESRGSRQQDAVDKFVISSMKYNQAPSEKMTSLVKHALRQLPPRIIDQLAAAGIRVMLAPHLTDVLPETENKHPRGWSSGATWHNANGTFSAAHKWIVVGEYYTDLTSGKEIADAYPDQTVCHELGHAYDYFLGNAGIPTADPKAERYSSFSHSQKFTEAYQKDVAVIKDPATRAKLAYFLQPGQSGQEELFAQLFPCFYNNIHQPNSPQELFAKCFPTVLATMREAFNTDLEWQKLFGRNVKMYK